MEVGTELPIHQTLHGYAEGHTLLAASCELSTAEKKQLLLMSDLSGSPVHPAFLSYLTGYPLPGKRYYAFARTWYATEMSRPGCVWTQTLLVNVAYLGQLKHLDVLNTLFIRPQQNRYSAYSVPLMCRLVSDSSGVANWSDEMFSLYEQIADNLYSKPTKKLLIPAAAPDLYELILLTIWSHQWPRLRRRFSFCSGALGLRHMDDTPLDCQIVPNTLNRSAGLGPSDAFVWLDSTQSGAASPWVDLMRQTPVDQLLAFMYQYGSDVKGIRSRFIPLVYAYQLQHKSQLQATSFSSLFEFLAKYFPSPDEAKRLKKELINRKLEHDTASTYEFIEAWLTPSWTTAIPDLNWTISGLISQLWRSDLYSAGQMSQLLRKADPSRLTKTDRLSIIQSLPVECWIEIGWIDVLLLTELLQEDSTRGESLLVWQASLPVQQQWIQALEAVDTVDWLAINEQMLMAGNGNWVRKVLQYAGVEALLASLSWANRTNQVLPAAWETVLIEQDVVFFGWLANQTEVASYLIRLITKLFKPKTIPLSSSPSDVWSKVIRIVLANSSDPYSTQAIALLFTACLVQNVFSTLYIVVILFDPLHERAKANQLNSDAWSLLKSLEQPRPAAKRSEGLWNLFFTKKENPPAEWDRCEYLRQLTVDYYTLYDWPPSAFSKMIVDEDVFIRIINYCMSFKGGKAYITELKRYLENQTSTTARKQLGLIHQTQKILLKGEKD